MSKLSRQEKYTQAAVDAVQKNDWVNAKRLARKILSSDAGNFNGNSIMGFVLQSEGNPQAALPYYQKALDAAGAKGDLLDLKVEASKCLKQTGRYKEALKLLDEVLTKKPEVALAWFEKGVILTELGYLDGALECFQQVLRIPCSGIDGAQLRANAHWYVLTSPEMELKADDLDAVRSDLEVTQSVSSQATLWFALGFGYERIHKYDLAFDAFTRANRIISTQYPINKVELNQDLERRYQQINEYRKIITDEFFPQDKQLVLICGLPRSGTTLIENILLNAEGVTSLGEFPAGPKAIELADNESNQMPYRNLKLFARRYLKSIDLSRITDRFLIDKLPSNFLYAGYFLAMSDNVIMINTFKEPLDACLSLYRQHFSHTLEHAYYYHPHTIVLMYKWHQQFMAEMKALYPDQVYNLNYERLITNNGQEWRLLFEFLGLSWSDDILNIGDVKRVISTISNAQVRRGIDKKYLNRAEKYGSLLSHFEQLLSLSIEELVELPINDCVPWMNK